MDRDSFDRLWDRYNLLVVQETVRADYDTPVALFAKMGDGEGAFLLESVTDGETVGRYSFFGGDPIAVVTGKDGDYGFEGAFGTGRSGSPLEALRALRSRIVAGPLEGVFPGGLVGFVAYDAVRTLERLPQQAVDDLGLPDIHMALPRLLYRYDHLHGTLTCTLLQPRGTDRRADFEEARERLAAAKALPARPLPEPWRGGEGLRELEAVPGKDAFLERVRIAKEAIADGECFQIVLSQRFAYAVTAPALEVYRALRAINPSPYLFFLHMAGVHLVGSSPEALVTVRGGTASTRPIAGTRRRGASEAEDGRLAQELLDDPKERAEHVMLVDLGRNDLGRVSVPGTVRVEELMAVERYSHVLHLVSRVSGRLRADRDALDALAAVFPAGTLSGAPKVRAMTWIERLEDVRRGPYGGAVGYWSLDGDLDACITIRTVLLRGERAYVQAGAGIVHDSDPEREWQECRQKAMALVEALRQAEAGTARPEDGRQASPDRPAAKGGRT